MDIYVSDIIGFCKNTNYQICNAFGEEIIDLDIQSIYLLKVAELQIKEDVLLIYTYHNFKEFCNTLKE